jgi:hypothetical protein
MGRQSARSGPLASGPCQELLVRVVLDHPDSSSRFGRRYC